MNPDIDAALGEASEHMGVTFDEGVATVEFRRPDKHNAISFAMWQCFARLMPVLADDDAVEVVVMRGTPGGPFSAGADIAEFGTLRADSAGAQRYSEVLAAGEGAIVTFPKPTIAAIEGFAIGGGTQIAIACDLRICGTSSRFAVTPAKLGVVYALSSTARLVEVVGPAWARWILLTAEPLTSGDALRVGLVHEVAADEHVIDRAYSIARVVASRAQVSLRGGKAMIDLVVAGKLAEDAHVLAMYEESYASAEYAEGVAAFLDKRAPDFPGARSPH